MAEIRIPTACIPADILLYLKTIRRSVMDPVTTLVTSTPSSSSCSSSSSSSSSSTSSSFASSSTTQAQSATSCSAPNNLSLPNTQTVNTLEPVPLPFTSSSPCSSSFPVMTLTPSSTGAAADVPSLTAPRGVTENSMLRVARHNQSVVPPLKTTTGVQRDVSRHTPLTTTSTTTTEFNVNDMFYADEVDGGDDVIHVFNKRSQLHQIQNMSCYNAVDDSGIVRIFPEEEPLPKSCQVTSLGVSPDDSNIVRVHTSNDDSENEQGTSTRKESHSKRSDIVRVMTQTSHPQIPSSSDFQMVEEENLRLKSPVDMDRRCNTASPHKQTKTTSPLKQETPNNRTSPETNNSMYSSKPRLSESNQFKMVYRHPLHPRTSTPVKKAAHVRSSMSINNETNSYISNANINIGNENESQMILTQQSHDIYHKDKSSSRQLSINSRRDKTPLKSNRQSQRISGHIRRSPELPTPPETPDADDEVFSYDGVVHKSDVDSECCDLDAMRHNLESTPRRDMCHFRQTPDKSPAIRNLTGKKSSPFSPTQGLAEMTMGDRQQTRKRLSFEDDDISGYIGSQKRRLSDNDVSPGREIVFQPLSVNQPRTTMDTRLKSSPTNCGNLEENFTSPKSLQQSPVNTNIPFRPSMPFISSDQSHVLSGSPQYQTATSVPVPFFHCSRPLSPYTSRAYNSQVNEDSFHRPPSQSPVQETFGLLGRTHSRLSQCHQVESPHRFRVHSDGDDVSDGWHKHASAHVTDPTDFGCGRPRGQTFSAYGKRRRIDQDDETCFPSPTSGSLEEDRSCTLGASRTSGSPSLLVPSSSTTPTIKTTASSSLSSSTSSSLQSQLLPAKPPKMAPHLEEAPAESSRLCSCATVEMEFLKMAEGAYKRIRFLDGPPNDFEHFLHELAKTNVLLRESMAVVKGIKAMCTHDMPTERRHSNDWL